MGKTKLFSLMAAALLTATTAWAAVNADDYKLPGAFSVSDTKKVYFSSGNLQYTKSTGKWKIMDHQYDMVETLSQNVGTNYADQDVVTLFGWATSGWESDTRTADFPYYTSSNNADYGVLATKTASETLTGATTNGEKGDWGVFNSGDLGAGWRTLTKDEWVYLFNTRTPGNSVNGVSNARYTEATINTDGTAVNGIILFPDDAVMTSVSGVTWGNINSSGTYGVVSPTSTQCTSAGWTALETAGCVFLPAAGLRNGTSVSLVGSYGYYWSSSAKGATAANLLNFRSGSVNPQSYTNRYSGFSVRLVSEPAPTPSEVNLTANQDPLNTLDYYSTFFSSSTKYTLPAGAEAYVATLNGDALNLTKIAEAGQVLPADNAVILKASGSSITLTPSDAAPVTFDATNNLLGVDAATAAPSNCYVLSGHSSDNSVQGVGFYQFSGTLAAHKAYVVIGGGGSMAPKRLRFVFSNENTATGVENVQSDNVQSTKVIENGVLYIEKNGVRYNAQGQIVK